MKKINMTREDVHNLIDNREGISVELKTCRQQVDHTVYESVCAFLNRLGGTIVMGVQDDGTVVGIEDKYIVQVQKTFVNAINNPEVLNPTKHTGDVGTTFFDDRCTLRCNLIEQYTALMDFVRKNMRGKEIADAAGSGRIDLRETIFRELVANFLVHREYQAHYQGRLFIYQDRFMTENYTKMVQRGKLTIDSLVPNQKNPMLSHVFGMMNYYEGVGKGMARLREYLWKYNANASVVFENEDLFRLNVVLPEGETQGPQSETEGPQLEMMESEITEKTPEITEKILIEVQRNLRISNQELSAIIGRSADSVYYYIKKLKIQGVLKRIGPDKGGYWEIVK